MSPPPCRPALLLALLAAGCASETKEPGAHLSIDTDALSFGAIAVGEQEQQRATVTNDGDVALEVLSASVVEGSTAAFSAAIQGEPALEPGDTVDIVLTFTPNEVGVQEGRVQVRTTWVDEPAWLIQIDGEGTASEEDRDEDGFSEADGDCDDGNPLINPAAVETCDGVDNDCDGVVSIDEADADYDGFRVCGGDCDDFDQRVHPGAREICDLKDSDCDGEIPDEADEDGDFYAICDGDCNDAEPLVYPDAEEVCDLLDNDCSGGVDDIDADFDGHSPCDGGGDCDDNDPDAYPVVVDINSTAGVPDGTAEAPFEQIADALAFLDPICRTIVVAPGTYVVDVEWTDRGLQINGAGTRPEDVVLTTDATAPDRLFYVYDGAALTLVNLTLLDGNGAGDGGAVRANNADLTLEGVLLRDNRSSGDGGAVAVSGGRLTVLRSVFTGNIAEDDGGGVSVFSGELFDQGNVYTLNQAQRGAGLLVENSQVDVRGSRFQENQAQDAGGGLAIVDGSALFVEGNIFWLNQVTAGNGGGMHISEVDLEDGVVRNNVLSYNQASGQGGGVLIGGNRAQFVFANNTLVANNGAREGGGIDVDAFDATGLYVWSNLLAWTTGPAGVRARDGSDANVAFNTAFATSSGTGFDLRRAEDGGSNTTDNPVFNDYSDDDDPSNDDLGLQATSPVRDSGPAVGEGPPAYTDWPDPDGSRNDRGMTGGPGAR
jgi:hypothetical protein